MKLQDLVPTPELCTLIPDGEFADSCLVYWGKKIILRRSTEKIVTFEKFYPAPTLQEIVEELSRMPKIINPTVWKQGEIWIMDCAYDPSGNLTGMLSEDFWKEEDLKTLDVKTAKDKNPPAAALRLWLELMGVGK